MLIKEAVISLAQHVLGLKPCVCSTTRLICNVNIGRIVEDDDILGRRSQPLDIRG